MFFWNDYADSYLTNGQSNSRGFASNVSAASDTCITVIGQVTASRGGEGPWTYSAKSDVGIDFRAYRAVRVTGTVHVESVAGIYNYATVVLAQSLPGGVSPGLFGADSDQGSPPVDLVVNMRLPAGAYDFLAIASLSPGAQPFYPPSVPTVAYQAFLCFETAPDTVLLSQPSPTTVRRGETIALSVTPTPEPPATTGTGTTTLQWQRNGVNLVDGGRVSGAQSTNLVITNAAIPDSGWYRVIATRDTVVEPSVFVRVDVLDLDAVDDVPGSAPAALALAAPVPNPVRAGARFHFALPWDTHATLELLDVSGRRVRELVRGPLAAGAHDAAWDGRDDDGSRVPAGVYFVRVSTGDAQQTRRVVYMPTAR